MILLSWLSDNDKKTDNNNNNNNNNNNSNNNNNNNNIYLDKIYLDNNKNKFILEPTLNYVKALKDSQDFCLNKYFFIYSLY